MNKEEAKEGVKKLVEEFLSLSKSELDSMKEEQLKWRFIEPLLSLFGWEKNDIEKESSVLRGRADYLLSLKNKEALVIEAKKPSVRLAELEGQQAVSYAYHRKIKFTVLTNFKQIRFYHALSNIRNIDKNLLKDSKGFLWIDCENYEKEFERLWYLSKESFENGEINKLLSLKDEKVNKPIDEKILEDLLKTRDILSKDLKSKRMELNDSQIDEVVQIFIDRLIFMRSVEDRGLEAENFLLKIMEDVHKGITEKTLWVLIKEQFARFDNVYDSRLFQSGILEKSAFFSDDSLKKVIKILYYGIDSIQEKYMFDEIPGDLFGNIYEQYLGTILAGTDKRVKLDSESGKRKKMGIYYTPSYIVDYIVKNTVGEYIKDKTIDEILDVNIVDPACGSGSFLIRAFKEVCDIIETKLRNGERAKRWNTFFEYKDKLNFSQKSTILKNCIYGVDLDEKAVELAQLNLLLKCLEGEDRSLKNRKLPNLLSNIKNGNSLIDDSSVAGDKAFNWQAQFKDEFVNGGFDIVIGNPPYVRNRELKKTDKDFLNKFYETADGQWDLYQLFFEKSIKIMKESAMFGFITSNKYAITNAAKKLRKFLLEETIIKNIVDISNISVFKDASTYPYILIFAKSRNNLGNKIVINKINSESDFLNLKHDFMEQDSFKEENDFLFDINSDLKNTKIIDKIINDSIKLGEIAVIKETVHTGNVREKILIEKQANNFCKKILRGKDCQRYYFVWKNLWINTDPNEINKKKGEYATIPDKSFFEKPKIFLREIAENITCCFDEDGFYSLNKAYVLGIKENIPSIKFLLGLLNSKLLSWFFRNKFESAHVRGGHLQFKKQYTSQIPIRLPSTEQEKKIVSLVNIMLELQKKYNDESIIGGEKERLKQQIDNIDYEINQEVYKLYELTSEDIKIVEESMKYK